YGAVSNALEGFALQSAFELPFSTSVASKFRWAIDFDTANSNGINFRNIPTGPDGQFRRITAADYAAQGAAIWNGTTQYGANARTIIQLKLQEGYTVFLPSWGSLGPDVAVEQQLTRPSGLSDLDWYTNVYRAGNAAVILYNPNTGGVSHLLIDPINGV